MAFIAFASAKGSPGVTTAVAALAATWPADRDLLVVEADPSGGDLVVRFDLATEPGLVTLAAAGRRELGSATLLDHTQDMPLLSADVGGQRRLLAAPVAADQSVAALSSLRGSLARTLDRVDVDVLVDCGRIDPTSPALDLATDADLLVMVARPVVAEVHHLASRLGSIKHQALSVLMVGEQPYSVSEVATAVDASPLGTLAADARAATVLSEGHPNTGRVLRRSRLLRDARALAEGLAGWLGTGPGTGASATEADAGAGAAGSPGATPGAASPVPAPGPAEATGRQSRAPGAQPPSPHAPASGGPHPPPSAPPPGSPASSPPSPGLPAPFPPPPGSPASSPPPSPPSSGSPASSPPSPGSPASSPPPPGLPAPFPPAADARTEAPTAPAPSAHVVGTSLAAHDAAAHASLRPLPSPFASPARDLAPVEAPGAGGGRSPVPPAPHVSPQSEPAEVADTAPKHFRRRGSEEPRR